MASAYVLIKVEAGRGREVYNELMRIKNVQHVDAVTGPFDLIAIFQGVDFNEIGQIILSQVQTLKGVKETLTCNVLKFEV